MIYQGIGAGERKRLAREALDRVNSDASAGTTNLGALLKAKLEQK